LTVSVDHMGAPIKVSFFGGVKNGCVCEPDKTDDDVLCVASMDDLFAHKLKVIHDRAEVDAPCRRRIPGLRRWRRRPFFAGFEPMRRGSHSGGRRLLEDHSVELRCGSRLVIRLAQEAAAK
jgi:hypothetical protein